jgi:hypothetical protein
MTIQHRALLMIMAAATLCLGACKSDGHGGSDAGAAMNDTDAAKPSSSDGLIDCKGKPTLMGSATSGTLAMGIEGAINARLVDATQIPPQIATADNPKGTVWTVDFTDPKGKPMADVEVLAACSYMPAHGHPNAAKMIVSGDSPGRFTLDQFRFTMSGDWEVQLALKSASAPDVVSDMTQCKVGGKPGPAGNDFVVFKFCIPDL